MVNIELKTKSVQHWTGTEGRNSGSFPTGRSCSSTFFFSPLYQDGIVILINLEWCQFFVWRSCDNAEGRKKSTYSLSPYHQVARLLQIQSVEKICKKFVTHKINLDNCLGKSIHNHQKKILVQAGFVWRTLSLVGRTLQRAFSHSSKSILPGAMTKTSLLIRRKTKILTKTEVRQNIPDLVGLTG